MIFVKYQSSGVLCIWPAKILYHRPLFFFVNNCSVFWQVVTLMLYYYVEKFRRIFSGSNFSFTNFFWRKVWKTFFIQHQLDNDDEEKVDEEESAKNIHIAASDGSGTRNPRIG